VNAISTRRAAGLDFGTTNSVAALSGGPGEEPRLISLEGPDGASQVFRSALCFWHDEGARGGLAVAAGPAAISEYLEYPTDSRFLQSFKSVAASRSFESASVFHKRFRFEELGKLFLGRMAASAGGQLDRLDRLVVGRPVEYVGARPDAGLARERYDAMFAGLAGEVHYVYEPLGAAFSYASRLTEPATLLVADFRRWHQRFLRRPGWRAWHRPSLRPAGLCRDRPGGRPVRLSHRGSADPADARQGRRLSLIRQAARNTGRLFRGLRGLVETGSDAQPAHACGAGDTASKRARSGCDLPHDRNDRE
jgi:hypothetical protein